MGNKINVGDYYLYEYKHMNHVTEMHLRHITLVYTGELFYDFWMVSSPNDPPLRSSMTISSSNKQLFEHKISEEQAKCLLSIWRTK